MLRKKFRLGHPFKNFMIGKINFWCFRADIRPKTKIFDLNYNKNKNKTKNSKVNFFIELIFRCNAI